MRDMLQAQQATEQVSKILLDHGPSLTGAAALLAKAAATPFDTTGHAAALGRMRFGADGPRGRLSRGLVSGPGREAAGEAAAIATPLLSALLLILAADIAG